VTLTRRAVLAAGLALPASTLLGKAPAMATALPPALFIGAHPDDETLAMGVTIAEHVAAGQDVHILRLTDGTASGVINMLNATGNPSSWWGTAHDPAAEGYAPLTPATFGEARVREFTTAVNCLAAGLTGTLTIHEGGLQDGAVTTDQAQAAIVAVADLIAPGGAPVRLKTHTWLVDNHPDHIAAGQAAKTLKAQARFTDVRHYIEQPYWSDTRLSQVSTAWDTPGSTDISVRARNACRAYGSWHPPQSYAIGYHSTGSEFAVIAGTPKCLFHT
jgi:LmbE family N-acetylglucosaminyl deacetylase